MAIRMLFDNTHNIIEPTFVLATRNGRKLGVIQPSEIHVSDNLNSYFELTFKVYRYNNGIECKMWDQIKDFKLLWAREWDVWFEIYVEVSDDGDVMKNVSARSVGEAELSQINLYNIEINTENDILRDDYEPTVLYNEDKPEASLLDRIMEKVPHYTVKHVDPSIAGLQRTFTFDNKSIYDALHEVAEEIDCLVVIGSGSNADGSIERSISLYDLESHCPKCGHRGEFIDKCPKCGNVDILTGYGDDTAIFISPENLADGITYSSDTDSVKNCFKLVAGDDLMTATIRNCNPNGSDYLWYISDMVKDDMPPELVERLEAYDKLYSEYKDTHPITLNSGVLSTYNSLVNRYKTYSQELETIASSLKGYSALMNAYYDTVDFEMFLTSGLMPSAKLASTTAKKEVAKLSSSSLSPVAVAELKTCSSVTATNAVVEMAKVIVDNRYKVKGNGNFSGSSWSGTLTLTNNSDEEDTATSGTITVTLNEDYEEFVQQKLDIALNKKNVDAISMTDMFKLGLSAFKSELKKYCLDRLVSFHDACQSCVDILIEQGIANNETWADKDPNMYEEVYIPYYQKMLAIEEETRLRAREIETITNMQKAVEDENDRIHDELNFEKYLGKELWLEFAAYRREDTYQNDNYISDGLDNAELFDRAREFIDAAEKEIYKSATLQHSITATLKNLLVMREFEPLVEHFAVGNWLRVAVDGNIYRLRLISYEVDFDNLETLSITFSDVMLLRDGISDSQSILDQMGSISSSYDSVKHQAGKGKDGADEMSHWVQDGLALTKMKIVDNADNQNITWDEHGLLCKEYLPVTDNYDNRQLKIINRGVYLTDDAWKTARAGIGNFTYFDPEDGEIKESYGVIANTLIGNLILSEKVGIYNTKNSIVLDENGIVLTAKPYEGDESNSVFLIRKQTGEDQYENVVYMDSEGNAHFKGEITATSLFIGDKDADKFVDDKVNDATTEWDSHFSVEKEQFESQIKKVTDYAESTQDELDKFMNEKFVEEVQTLKKQADQKAETWYQDDPPTWDPSLNEEHIGDIWFDSSPDVQKSFRWDGTQWVEMDIMPPQEVFDKIDGKAQIFVSQPIPPYFVGDLWFDSDQEKKADIWTCIRARAADEPFYQSDWQIRNKYTDKATVEGLIREEKATIIQQTEEKIALQAQTIKDYSDRVDGLEKWKSEAEVKIASDAIISTVTDSKKYKDDIGRFDYFINNTYKNEMDDIKQQTDSKAETWYQTTQPTWPTNENANHKGDIWYDITNKVYKIWDGTKWNDMKVSPPDAVFNRIDGKAQIFVGKTPTPPYFKGDLWFSSNDTTLGASDILTCILTNRSGEFSSSHWRKLNKYTDINSVKTDTVISQAIQNANKFKWLVSDGSSESSLTLTQSMLNAIANEIELNAIKDFKVTVGKIVSENNDFVKKVDLATYLKVVSKPDPHPGIHIGMTQDGDEYGIKVVIGTHGTVDTYVNDKLQTSMGWTGLMVHGYFLTHNYSDSLCLYANVTSSIDIENGTPIIAFNKITGSVAVGQDNTAKGHEPYINNGEAFIVNDKYTTIINGQAYFHNTVNFEGNVNFKGSTITGLPSNSIKYTSGETNTGNTWIDGKSIYRYIQTIGTITAGKTQSYTPTVSLSAVTLISISGSVKLNNGDQMPFPSVGISDANSIDTALTSDGKIRIRVGTSLNVASGYAIIEYAK